MEIEARLSVPQAEFLKRDDDPLIVWQAGVGSGKTYVCSLYLIKHMLEGRRMVAGALTHGALMKTLFRQCFDLAWRFGFNPKLNKQDKTLQVGKGITFGYSSEAENDVLGLSDIYGLVLDEASRCKELFYNNLSDRLRGEGLDEPHKRLITSPCTEPGSEWYNELKRKHPEAIIRASLYTNPFVSEKYIHELEDRYAIGSKLYKQQVLGEDIDGDFLNAIVKLEDFANRSETAFSPLNSPTFFGLDLAGMGRDLNVATLINDNGLIEQRCVNSLDTAGQVNLVRECYDNRSFACGALDFTGGYGNGVYDGIKHDHRIHMMKVTFGEAPLKDIYLNVRSEMYMELADAIRHGFYVDVEANPLLVEELRNTQVFIDEKGKLRIIPKEMIKKIIGRSPDRADSLALAVYARNHGQRTSAIEVARKILALNY